MMKSTNDSFQGLLANIEHTDQDLLNTARTFYHSNTRYSSVREVVRSANEGLGVDFATALLYVHFASKLSLASPLPRFPDCGADSTAPLIVIAPGAFHREHPEVGGDGQLVKVLAEENEWECASLSTESLGSLDVNAQITTQWLEKNRERRIILVSLSKGTADVMVALSKRPDLANRINAWISISGIVFGTMMSNWLLDRKRLRPALWYMLWKHRAGVQAIRDLRAGKDEQLRGVYDQLAQSVTAEIPTFHIAGFPLKRHLSSMRSRLWHRRFQSEGPNDSVVLLEDLLDYHGTIVPVWGADHYLKSSSDPTRILHAIIEWVLNSKAAKQL